MLWSAMTTRLIGVTAKVRALRLVADVFKASRKGQLDFADLCKAAPLDTESTQQYALRVLNGELVAARICPDRGALLQPFARELEYTRAITVALGTRKPPHSPAFLVLMPNVEDADVALLFLEHNKARGLAPTGHRLLSCVWAADSSNSWFDASDEAIVARTGQSVIRVFPELAGQFEHAHVTRWREALQRMRPGSYKLIAAFNAAQDAASRIQFAGDYMSGAGQNTAVEFGNRAAGMLIGKIGVG